MSRPARIPSYRLHKPSGQAIVVIRGNKFYLGRLGSVESRSEYARIMAEWHASGHATPPPVEASEPAGCNLTVDEFRLAYYHRSEE